MPHPRANNQFNQYYDRLRKEIKGHNELQSLIILTVGLITMSLFPINGYNQSYTIKPPMYKTRNYINYIISRTPPKCWLDKTGRNRKRISRKLLIEYSIS